MTAFALDSAQLLDELVEAVEGPHRAADAAFADGRPLVAVGWVCAHLAAVDAALLPAVSRLPGGSARVNDQRVADRAAHLAAFHLERRLTGDVMVGQASVERLSQRLRAALDAHADYEQRLLAHAARSLDDAAQAKLAQALHRAFECAPTRPHPYAPHRGRVGSLAFRVEALIDHVRDVLDNRHLGVAPSRPTPPPPGRWGMYLLGAGNPPAGAENDVQVEPERHE